MHCMFQICLRREKHGKTSIAWTSCISTLTWPHMYIPYIPHRLNATIGDRVVLLVVDCVFVIFFLCSCHCSPSCPSPMLLRVALVSWTVLIKCWTWIPWYFRALWSGIAETADWYLWAYGKTHRKPMEADSTWDIITMVNTIAGWWFGTWISFFHVLGTIIPTVTYSIIFQRGWKHLKPLTTNQIVSYTSSHRDHPSWSRAASPSNMPRLLKRSPSSSPFQWLWSSRFPRPSWMHNVG